MKFYAWQDKDGDLYRTSGNAAPTLYDSFSEAVFYLMKAAIFATKYPDTNHSKEFSKRDWKVVEIELTIKDSVFPAKASYAIVSDRHKEDLDYYWREING